MDGFARKGARARRPCHLLVRVDVPTALALPTAPLRRHAVEHRFEEHDLRDSCLAPTVGKVIFMRPCTFHQ